MSHPGPSSCLAPSQNGYGWGVFAARSFSAGDVVDVSPMFLRVALEDDRAKVLKETVLNNYHYEYWSWDGVLGREIQYDMISFGMSLYYNHRSPSESGDANGPNIEQRKVGKEPDIEATDQSTAIIYYALRDINDGDELLVDYGSGWFEERGLVEISNLLSSASSDSKPPSVTNMKPSLPNLISGYHQEIFRRVLALERETGMGDMQPYRLETALSLLPATKASFGRVLASECIDEGSTIDFAPALILQKSLVKSTILEPLAFSWDDIHKSSRLLPEQNGSAVVHVQHQPDIEGAVDGSRMVSIRVDESVLLILAGSISLMARSERQTGSYESINAMLQVELDPYNEHSYCVRAVATKRIEVMEKIVLGVHTVLAQDAIHTELCLTGQPFHLS